MIERLGTGGAEGREKGARGERKTDRGKGGNEGEERAGKEVAEGKVGETLKCLTLGGSAGMKREYEKRILRDLDV